MDKVQFLDTKRHGRVDAKDAGTGPAKYKFVKTWNKYPFKARAEYVIFDKILAFDVDEYEVDEE